MKTSWKGRAVIYNWGVVKTLRSHRYIVLLTNRESEYRGLYIVWYRLHGSENSPILEQIEFETL